MTARDTSMGSTQSIDSRDGGCTRSVTNNQVLQIVAQN